VIGNASAKVLATGTPFRESIADGSRELSVTGRSAPDR